MKIVICGSMSASQEMLNTQAALVKLGHAAIVPENTETYAAMGLATKEVTESARNKTEHDLIKGYFIEIQNNDAVLIVNVEKNGMSGYVGANAFLEMGFAHILDKKIFLLNSASASWHADEIAAMKPIVLNGHLEKIA